MPWEFYSNPNINPYLFHDKESLCYYKHFKPPVLPETARHPRPLRVEVRIFPDTHESAMQQFRKARLHFPEIELFIRMPSGLVALDENSGAWPLPPGPAPENTGLSYGPYLRAVAGYFSAKSSKRLKDLLAAHSGEIPGAPTAVRLVSEKHGALYSVSRLQVFFENRETAPASLDFAINTAFLPEQQAFLAVEYRLLKQLDQRFHPESLPRPLLFGKTGMETGGTRRKISLFACRWFDNHHEFHLAPADGGLGLRVWKPGEDALFLGPAQTDQLYRQAAGILTDLLDTHSFRQIYPWHHGAGDFVVDESRDPVSVCLVTARSYRAILAPQAARNKLLGSLHFFANLGIRMRMDRLDGTGPLAWAGPECLPGIVRGFARSWKNKVAEDIALPPAPDIFAFILSFSFEEQFAFVEAVATDGEVESGEADFMGPHLPAHIRELCSALRAFLDDEAK
jgi:hypothetical protein